MVCIYFLATLFRRKSKLIRLLFLMLITPVFIQLAFPVVKISRSSNLTNWQISLKTFDAEISFRIEKRPFSNSNHSQSDPKPGAKNSHLKLFIVVPFSNTLDRLKRYLTNLDRELLAAGEVRVLLATTKKEKQQVEHTVSSVFPNSTLRGKFLVIGEMHNFTRGGARNRGVAEVAARCINCTVFFCDLDMVFSRKLIGTCLANVVKGRRAWFPIVCSEPGSTRGRGDPLRDLPASKCHWRKFGTGNSCIHVQDVITPNGTHVFPERKRWGEEDGEFMAIFRRKKYKIVRERESELIHMWHPAAKRGG